MSHDEFLSVADTSKSRRRIKESGGGKKGLERLLKLEADAISTSLDAHGVKDAPVVRATGPFFIYDTESSPHKP